MDRMSAGATPVSRLRRAAAGALALVIGCLLLGASPSTAAGGPASVTSKEVVRSPEAIESAWSPSDLARAEPVDAPVPAEASFDLPELSDASTSSATGDFPVADASAYPARLHGKVFFRFGEDLYECSGTLVDSRRGNVIYTAGHCVYDTATSTFATDFVFAPGYADGVAPFGLYAATNLSTTSGWANDRDYSFDLAVVTLSGAPEADIGDGRPLAFDINPNGRKYTVYGYPASPSPTYDGSRLIGCQSRYSGRDSGSPPLPLSATPCFMANGASGGGWVTGGYLNSLTSYIYCQNRPQLCGYVFGPYFSNAAKKLYTSGSVGGSATPSFRIKSRPPAKVNRRKVVFRFEGSGSTPISFKCRFDNRRYVSCGSRTAIRRLTPGRHTLRVKAFDQTGRRAPGVLTSRFRVSLPR